MKPLKIALAVLFEPMQGFRMIQRDRDRFSHLPTLVLLFLTVAVRVASIFLTHYPLTEVDPRDTNIGREVANTILPLLTWVVGCYLVTTIHQGESLFREVLQAATYSMLPYILLTVPIALLSNVLVSSDVLVGTITYVQALQGFVWAWVGILFLVSLGQMNSYGFLETLRVTIITLFTCIFIWAVLTLIYILGNNLFRFLSDVAYQYRNYFFGD